MSLLNICILLAVSSIGVACWWRYAINPSTRLEPLLADQSRLTRWGLIDVFIFAGLWLIAQGVASALFQGAITPGTILTSFFLQALFILGALGVVSVRYHYGRWDLWVSGIGRGRSPLREIKIGATAFAMWAPLVWIVQSVLINFVDYDHQTFRTLREEPNFGVLVQAWLSAVVLAPIVEEILFRGILQGWLQRFSRASQSTFQQIIFGNRPGETGNDQSANGPRDFHAASIVVTSLFFGGAHATQGPAPVSLFVFSLGLGFVYQRTGSLLACIVMHMLLNLFAMSLFTFEILFPTA